MLEADVNLISVDDHVVEPADVWQNHLPANLRERGPRVVDLNDTDQAWVWEGRTYPIALMGNAHTRVFHGDGVGEDLRARGYHHMVLSCYDVAERVRAMDTDGVHAALTFPTFPRFAGTRFLEGDDKALAAACVRAYNDWMIEEWCGAAPDRLIPIAIVPLWDPELAVAEVRRVAARGVRAVSMSENPAPLGLPSFWTEYWDPVWRVVQDLGLVVAMHIGSSGKLIKPSEESTEAVSFSLAGLNSMVAVAELVFSGTLNRFSELRIALSEGGAGWVPYLVERLDYTWARSRTGVSRELPPSELFRRHFWLCFIDDEAALKARDVIGVERLMWEADFPHNDSNWPDSRTLLAKALADVPDEACRRIGELNARELYDFWL